MRSKPGRAADLELFAALDAELDRLPDRLRLPVVLVHLDGRTYADAATALGIPVGTLSGRLTRARSLLKDRLTRRGLAPLAVAVVAADAGRVAAVARSAVLFAAGHPLPHPSTSIAFGVLRAMTLPKLLAATAAGFLAVTVTAVGLAHAPPPQPPPPPARAAPDTERMQGEWLFESATDEQGRDALQSYWNARLTFRKDTVAMTGGPYRQATIETTFTLDPTTSPKRMDWVIPEYFLAQIMRPDGAVKGIYTLVPDGSLEVCMANSSAGERPTEFQADAAKGHFRFTVKRWTGKPGEKLTEGKVMVMDPDGKPGGGATVETLWQRMPDEVGGPVQFNVADAAGVAKLQPLTYPAVLTARLTARRLIGIVDATPAGLHHGLTARLAPQCAITGKLAVDPPPATGGTGWTNVYLRRPGGSRFLAGYADTAGRFEFVAPPGDYELYCYGDIFSHKTVPLTVPPGVAAVDAGTVTGGLTRWGTVVGKPHLGLPGVVKWVGTATPPEAWTGRVVLLYFANVARVEWQPAHRDTLVALYQKYAGKGLAVVGVYGDGADERLNAAGAAVESLKLPFPVAVCGGRGDFPSAPPVYQAATAYGVEPPGGFGVLLDRRGVVRGRWHPDAKSSDGLLEKLLAE